ncbi:endonuclease/exonuclease/phosphatase family protein [Pendulispora albinea]|uniref:Endonuclease/exonuclease/phosphatase family protein n=1 Tax=Pendulispora albinea TaxID=2741071 RepID=A0ABZ2LZU3_9BACT
MVRTKMVEKYIGAILGLMLLGGALGCAADRAATCGDEGCGPADRAFPSGEEAPLETRAAATRIRIMAANLTSGNAQSYTPGEGIRILEGLKPDVAMLQEFNYGSNSAADLRSFVDTAFGTSFTYFREGGGKQIPNGIVSRYPIRASGTWEDPQSSNREFAWARLDIPGTPDLWAISVHLLTSSAATRATEASALVSFINQNVPSSDYVALAGDFNTSSRTEECITKLGAVFVTAGPYPQDASGNGNTNANRNKPYDWVLANGKLNALGTPVQVGSASFGGGLVFDSRVFTPLAAVSPVQAGDSAAVNMQHMGVVRDFRLP